MKKLHRPRTGFRPRGSASSVGSRGFSLIELMVTIAVVTILASVAFAGMRQNDFEGQYIRFVQDVEGVLVRARNRAIEEQTPMQLTVQATGIAVASWDAATGAWIPVDAVQLGLNRDELLLAGQRVCLYGFAPGVQTPAQFTALVPPNNCLGAPQILRFEPDGTFSDPNNAFSAPNTGVTLWIADRTDAANEGNSLVQIFPGGLIRTFKYMGR